MAATSAPLPQSPAAPQVPSKRGTSTKRVLLDKANSTIMITVGVAAFITVFALVASKALLSETLYNNRLISAKKDVLNQLQENVKATDKLVSAYKTFDGKSQNIIKGNSHGNGPNDGSNSRIILDALPAQYDFPALATSLEKIITSRGVTIEGIQGTDDEVNQQNNTSSTDPQPVPMPFQIAVQGKYQALQGLIDDFQNSIRPFQIQSLSLSGAEDNMTLTLSAQTFYQPGKQLNIGTKVVK